MSNDLNSKILSILWPMRIAENPNIIQRTGRVLHWSIVSLGVLGVAFSLSRPSEQSFFFLVFVVCVLAGRAVRYILSAE